MLTRGFHSAFLAGAGIALLGLLATITLVRTRDSAAHVEMARATAAQPALAISETT